jgi:hypothetical protein
LIYIFLNVYIIKEEKLEKFNIDKKGQRNKWPNKERERKKEPKLHTNKR